MTDSANTLPTPADETIPYEGDWKSAPRQKTITLPTTISTFTPMGEGSRSNEVELRRTMGWEEDLLRDDSGGLRGKITRIARILSMCTVRIGEKRREKNAGDDHESEQEMFVKEWEEAPSPARTFAWIRLRQLSLGHAFKFGAPCPHCRRLNKDLIYNLNAVEVFPIAEETVTKTQVLESEGFRIEWEVLRGKDEWKISDMREKNPSNLESAEIFPFIKSINGKKPNSVKELVRLPSEVRAEIREAINVGGPSLIVTNECENRLCRGEFSTLLPIFQRSFFIPSERTR